MRRQAGFTLVEMLAVILMVAIVVSGATTFYFQLSRESNRAADETRVTRRVTAVMDRMARELEGTVLVVKPEEVDPLSHPWLFFAERTGLAEQGADRLKFVTRAHRPRASALHESDLAVVSYALAPDPEGRPALWRWTSPRLPEGLDRRVADRPDDGAQLLVGDVSEFGLRFLGDDGAWKETWDSSTLPDTGTLPVAVEIQLALASPQPEAEPGFAAPPLRRQVVLPLRPLDLAELLGSGDAPGGDGDGDEEEGEGDGDADGTEPETGPTAQGDDEDRCVTVAQCIAAHPEIDAAALLQAAGLPPNFLSSIANQCAGGFASFLPIPPDCR